MECGAQKLDHLASTKAHFCNRYSNLARVLAQNLSHANGQSNSFGDAVATNGCYDGLCGILRAEFFKDPKFEINQLTTFLQSSGIMW